MGDITLLQCSSLSSSCKLCPLIRSSPSPLINVSIRTGTVYPLQAKHVSGRYENTTRIITGGINYQYIRWWKFDIQIITTHRDMQA